MKSKKQLLADFEAWIPFAIHLKEMDPNKWTEPIKAGKWSTRDVISHIMLWDKYFLESAIEKIGSDAPFTLTDLPFNEFNENAMVYAETTSQDQLLNETIHVRKAIIEQLKVIPEENYEKAYIYADGRHFHIREYLTDFISHDEHHRGQIQNFLGRTLPNTPDFAN